jgi:hypothetical protein
LFTRCSDELGVREYVKAVFAVSPAEHVWDFASAVRVQPERIWDVERGIAKVSAFASQDAYEELAALEAKREERALPGATMD